MVVGGTAGILVELIPPRSIAFSASQGGASIVSGDVHLLTGHAGEAYRWHGTPPFPAAEGALRIVIDDQNRRELRCGGFFSGCLHIVSFLFARRLAGTGYPGRGGAGRG
jgi:hypothetical protein